MRWIKLLAALAAYRWTRWEVRCVDHVPTPERTRT